MSYTGIRESYIDVRLTYVRVRECKGCLISIVRLTTYVGVRECKGYLIPT
jgi:hypothetical protein